MLDLSASAEQEQLAGSVRVLLEKESGPEVVREAEPGGFSRRLWEHTTAMGLPTMAVPEILGGGGAGLLDAVLVAELLGEFLAPAPVVEMAVAARLLARLDTAGSRAALAASLGDGGILTVALVPPSEDRLTWVPAGAVAARVVARRGDEVLVTADPAPGVAIPNLGSLPVADRSLAEAEVIARGADVRAAWAAALDDWRVLQAAWRCGAGRAALDGGVEYAKQRHAFGVPVASYQAVAHRMADLATALDGARLLARKAGWAVDRGDNRRRALALMAAIFSARAAEAAATDALHFHGGYGFMLEYDAQLYLRRIKAQSVLGGGSAGELRDLGDELWGPAAAP